VDLIGATGNLAHGTHPCVQHDDLARGEAEGTEIGSQLFPRVHLLFDQ